MDETFLCYACKQIRERKHFDEWSPLRSRPVATRCKKCRARIRFEKRYPIKCEICLARKKLTKNGICEGCNAAVGLRECRSCRELLPIEICFFGAKKRCKDCMAKNRKPPPRSDIRVMIDKLKGRPCTDCGHSFDPVAMDYDHVPGRGAKVDAVGSMIWDGYYTKKQILAEIAKCDLVCANCHRIRTYKQGRLSKERKRTLIWPPVRG